MWLQSAHRKSYSTIGGFPVMESVSCFVRILYSLRLLCLDTHKRARAHTHILARTLTHTAFSPLHTQCCCHVQFPPAPQTAALALSLRILHTLSLLPGPSPSTRRLAKSRASFMSRSEGHFRRTPASAPWAPFRVPCYACIAPVRTRIPPTLSPLPCFHRKAGWLAAVLPPSQSLARARGRCAKDTYSLNE